MELHHSGDEAVPGPGNGLNVVGCGGVVSEVAPELLYGSIDAAHYVYVLAFFPETCGDLIASNQFAGAGDEQKQQTEA